jgi:hypothetical protein
MPLETIRFTVAGANPAQQSIQVTVDSNGNAVGNFTYAGANVGVDTIQAFMDSHSLSSNQAQATWQNGNGLISLTGVTANVYAGDGTGVVPATPSTLWFTQNFNSLMFNTHPQSLLAGDPHQSGNQAQPFVNNAITYAGAYSGDVIVQGNGIQAGASGANFNFVMCLTGSFIVTKAGSITLTAYADAAYVLGIQGASYVSGPNSNGGVTHTFLKNYPVIAAQNDTNWANVSEWAASSAQPQVINFPEPGVYNFEIMFATGNHGEREFCLLANGNVIPPVAAVSAPPAPAPGTGSLILSPNATGPNLVGTNQSFTLQISGIKYTTVTCLPLLEGKSGTIIVANVPGGTTYSLPTLPNGATIPTAQVIANLIALSGNNGSWANRLSIVAGSNGVYNLSYNGAAVDPNIATTQLTVTTRDVAYYSSAKNTFDLFNSTSQGGGSSASIQVNWQVAPSIASVMPTTLKSGGNYSVTFNLAKPLPPIQKNIAAVFTGGGGLNVVGQTTNLNSSGFITGWTVSVTTPVVQGNGAKVTIALTASGSITYLSGTSFETQTVTYINNLVTSIALTAA